MTSKMQLFRYSFLFTSTGTTENEDRKINKDELLPSGLASNAFEPLPKVFCGKFCWILTLFSLIKRLRVLCARELR